MADPCVEYARVLAEHAPTSERASGGPAAANRWQLAILEQTAGNADARALMNTRCRVLLDTIRANGPAE